MKKFLILLISLVYLTMMSCKHSGTATEEHDHDHESEMIDHEGEEHDHEEEDHDHEHKEDDHDHEEHEHEYKTAKVKIAPFNQIIKTSGEIQAANTSEIELVASNSGIVHFVDSKMAEGTVIKTGQALFYISGEDLVENNISVKYNQAKSAYDKAKTDYDRAEQLVKQNIISDKEFQQQKMIYTNAKADFDVISKSRGKGSISSPSDAFVQTFFVKEGQFVETGQKIASIIKQNKIMLIAEVSQKYSEQLTDIESATFTYANSKKVYDTQKLNGKLLAYAKALNTESYYLPVTFEIDYQKDLIPGSFVQIYLKSKKTDQFIVIPKSALIEEQGNFFVYVETAHDKFKKQQVTLGEEDGVNVTIKDGLKVDETIVTEGAYFVKLASMSGGLPAHSHNH